jgi:hypothetical protein
MAVELERMATKEALSSSEIDEQICRMGAPPVAHSTVSSFPIVGTCNSVIVDCRMSTVSSAIVRNDIALPHSPDANATIGIERRPEVSIPISTARPKSKRVEVRGLHASALAVVTLGL